MDTRKVRRRLRSVKRDHHQGDDAAAAREAHFADALGLERGHIPEGFARLKDGIYAAVEREGEDGEPATTYEFVCSSLEVVAIARDEHSTEWGRLLAVTDPDKTVHRWAMPMSMTAGDGTGYREELLRLGLRLGPGPKARQRLHEYVTRANPTRRARSVLHTGWHDGRYVTSDGSVIGDGTERVVLQTPTAPTASSQMCGPLEHWQTTVAGPCLENSRLILAVSLALAAPLLNLVEHESGGFHLRGPSSIGKTTAARVAASVWGSPEPGGIVRTWRGTDNGLEAVAAQHGDALLVLDELSQVDARVAGEIAYMLASGSGKSRARRDGGARAPFTWRLLFFSTGEISLADKMMEGGRRVRAGQEARLVDIPAEAGAGFGVFEHLHDSENADAFAQRLRRATGEAYGTAALAFIRGLVKARAADRAALRASVRTYMDQFLTERLPAHADGQVTRVASRFALVAAAGELAATYQILPWPEAAASNGVGSCFEAWLADRPGGKGPAEIAQALEQVRLFIHLHGAARFERTDVEQKVPVRDRAGIVHQLEYCIFPEVWRSEVCKGHNPTDVARWASDAGLLVRGEGNHLQANRWFAGRSSRFFVVQLRDDNDEKTSA